MPIFLKRWLQAVKRHNYQWKDAFGKWKDTIIVEKMLSAVEQMQVSLDRCFQTADRHKYPLTDGFGNVTDAIISRQMLLDVRQMQLFGDRCFQMFDKCNSRLTDGFRWWTDVYNRWTNCFFTKFIRSPKIVSRSRVSDLFEFSRVIYCTVRVRKMRAVALATIELIVRIYQSSLTRRYTFRHFNPCNKLHG